MGFTKERGFRSIASENEAKAKASAAKRTNSDDLNWVPVPFESARLKYKFKIFSQRNRFDSRHRRYIIRAEAPNITWEEVHNVPDDCTFEEAKDREFNYIRMCKLGLEERGARMKIPRRT